MERLSAELVASVFFIMLFLGGTVRSESEDGIVFPSDEEEVRCEFGQYWDLRTNTCHPTSPESVTGKAAEALVLPSTRIWCPSNEVYWPGNEKCYTLTNQGPCSSSEWLVLDRETHKPVCKKRPCTPNQALWPSTRTCVEKDTLICQPNQILIDDYYGEGLCECRRLPVHVFWTSHSTCYPLYRQGPCSPGNYVVLANVSSEYKPTCLYNQCEKDGMVYFKDACYELESPGPCQGAADILTVNATSLALECLPLTRYIARTQPGTVCGPGSKMDQAGQCRKVHNFSK